MSDQLEKLFAHLRLESNFLDTLIHSSREVQTILRNSRSLVTTSSQEPSLNRVETNVTATDAVAGDSPPVTGSSEMKRSQQTRRQLERLHHRMLFLSKPLLESRRQLPGILAELCDTPEKATLSSIAASLPQPVKGQLMELRWEIRGKMDQVYAISMGNQAVLIYTLDFYDQLLPGSRSDSGCYNATGQTQNQYDAGVIKNHC